MADKYEQTLIESSKKSLQNATDPIEVLRLKCLAKGTTGIAKLGKLFRKMDTDGNEQLNLSEFTEGLKNLELIENATQANDLFTIFDKDNSGTISSKEFLSKMTPTMSERRRNLVRAVFDKFDASGDGEVTLCDFQKQDSLSKQDFLNFVRLFDSPDDRDGKVTWPEFHDYYSSVSMSIVDDESFESMLPGGSKK